MFLIRTAFWLTLVILLIPGNPATNEDAPSVSAMQALSAVQVAVTDMSGFCERNPSVCTTSQAAFAVLSDKARNGMRMIYDYLDREDGAPQIDRGTLQEEDLLPAWRGDAEGEQPV